jgi:cob(I)alamin adenosyltransferase
MGHRLSNIYTRTGDDGTTGLGDGTRIAKDSARVEAYGTVDELNSVLGWLRTHDLPESMQQALREIQHELFDLGGELCVPDRTVLAEAQVTRLENLLDHLNRDLSPLKEFILPGGSPAAAVCHVARTVCRRAERGVISLARTDKVNPVSIQYLNRLSDLFFVMARALNALAGQADILWTPRKKS